MAPFIQRGGADTNIIAPTLYVIVPVSVIKRYDPVVEDFISDSDFRL